MIVRSTKKAFGQFAALLLVLCSFCIHSEAQTIRYVRENGIGDGLSWTTAAGDLQAVINASAVGDEIWVAEGTYLPTRPANNLGVVVLNDRNNAFTFTKDLTIYGGFPAMGNPGMADRDWEAHPSVLNGNLGDPDTHTDNAYHVVITAGASVTSDFFMDGFTITGGYGNGPTTITVNGQTSHQSEGAGWHNVAASPTVSHLLVTGNVVYGSGNGGGWYNNLHARVTITHSVIRGNEAGLSGGGLHAGNSSDVILRNVTISDNSAFLGGGASIEGGSSAFTNVAFSGNIANDGGGLRNADASLALANVLISGNKANRYGGGMYNDDASSILTNVTVSGNTAIQGSAMYCTGLFIPPPTIIRNSVIWGNNSTIFNPFLLPAVSHSILQEEAGDATNIVGVDPRFIGAPEAIEAPFTHGDYRLQPGSPAIDAGNNALYSGDLAADDDLTGNPRLTKSTIDMGAYEFKLAIAPGAGNIAYVSKDVDQTVPGYKGDGSSWQHAVPELADALTWAKANATNWTETNPLQIWVAAGIYMPPVGTSFEMVDHVAIYGGFKGNETSVSQRVIGDYLSTLQGRGASVVHNPEGLTLSREAKLDGFLVKGGEAPIGGGILNYGDATFTHLYIAENAATSLGGNVYNAGSPLFHDVVINYGSAEKGAGFYNASSTSAPVLVNVSILAFTEDSEDFYLEAGNPVIRNSIIYGNGVFGITDDTDIQYSLVEGRMNTDNGNITHENFPLLEPSSASFEVFAYPTSRTINAGSNQAYIDLVGPLEDCSDVSGLPRLRRNTIDMGAFETPYWKAITPDVNHIVYIDKHANQTVPSYQGDGSSWEQAVPELADALLWARVIAQFDPSSTIWNQSNPLKIYVAKGTYLPLYHAGDGQFLSDGQRDNAFVMAPNTRLYGGFDPTAGILKLEDARILPTDEGTDATDGTILSGNIGDPAMETDNTYHVVITVGNQIDEHFLMDGFTVTGGYGNSGGDIAVYGQPVFKVNGGGWYNAGGSPRANNLLIANNTIGVTGSGNGAGWFNLNGSPVLTNSIIRGNTASLSHGGGMANLDNSHPLLTNVLINGNTVVNHEGSGIYNFRSSATLNNVTITANTEDGNGGVISNYEGTVDIANSIIYGNSGGISGSPALTVSHSLVQGLDGGSNGNLDGAIDPLFADPDNGNFTLQIGSPAINTGNNDAYPGDLAADVDLVGSPRLIASTIDIGAFESPYADIVALGALAVITVPYGTELANIPMPDLFSVEATLDDGTTVEIALPKDPTQWTLVAPAGANFDGHAAGTYSFEITIADDADEGYGNPLALRATVDVMVEKGVPVISWATPVPITYETLLDSDQLNATADVAGTFTYDPAWDAALPAGNHTLEVTFAPDDDANYTTATAEVMLTVNKAQAVITADAVQTYTYNGTVKTTAASLNHTETALGFDPQAGYTDVGRYLITITAAETANYEAASGQVAVVITKADWTGTPVTFPDSDPIGYDGEPHEITAGPIPAGSEVSYTVTDSDGNKHPGNEVTDAGEYTVTVTIRQDNYEDIVATTPVVIIKSTPVITWSNPEAITYGAELGGDRLNAQADVAGTFVYTPVAKTVLDAGEHTLKATFIPRDDINYHTVTAEVILSVHKAEALITATEVQTRYYDGTIKHTEATLNHDETTLAYSPQQGYIETGEYTITVSAPETDNYQAVSTEVILRIQEAIWDGTPVTFPASDPIGYDGEPHEIIAGPISVGSEVSYTVTDSDGNIRSGNEVTDVGEYTVTVTIRQDNYGDIIISTPVTVRPATRTINFPALPEKMFGDDNFLPGAIASSGEPISYASDQPTVATMIDGRIRLIGAGIATISATVPQNKNYANTPVVHQTLIIHKAPQQITLNTPLTVDRSTETVAVHAVASSGLPVTLTLDDPQVATLTGTTLNIHRLGTVQITATQLGDENHEAADTVIATVRVIDPDAELPMRVSKVVSPNSDGINEYLVIEGIKDYPENKVTVFNRNGTILYEAKGYNNGSVAFRGISTAQLPLPAGTYFYVAEIRVNGIWKYEKGWFVLRY
ncbi:choice-of-anchor Q domain-containing protein [Parapedobacter indicus]|uniref:Gliding motility-associated C-terminal domain-containing protein n=1 Tax=Parapedobacter indicus TaxID=1477437 RepID=A0A1I3QLW4_9SPHI|nr:choice-of-anchor Q domain-containing protein [Parapedobacter indicus]PPL00141.1 gliding motility-associated-like protein [Parapedobacter indicus]SFJ34196.1 gliding motility-associated C-terminal domain-containing protein [Parapedobacter indicus]